MGQGYHRRRRGSASAPQGVKKFLGMNLCGKLEVHPGGRECSPSEGRSHIFYSAEEGATFNLRMLRISYQNYYLKLTRQFHRSRIRILRIFFIRKI